jgi:hypothetical protein
MVQIVECFPNTLPKELPELLSKTKWSRKPSDVQTWDDWWDIHPKVRHCSSLSSGENNGLNYSRLLSIAKSL